MAQSALQLCDAAMALRRPHIEVADLREVDLAGRLIHVFAIDPSVVTTSNPMTMLETLFLRASEVVEGFPSQAIQNFLRDLRHHRSESRVPDFVWLDSNACDMQAITPVSLADALGFWSGRAFCGDPWAKRITKGGIEVEATVFAAFGWGADSLANQGLAWPSFDYSPLADGGLIIQQSPPSVAVGS